MAECSFCRATIVGLARFCRSCGSPQSSGEPTPSDPADAGRGSRLTLLLVGLVAVALGVGGAAAALGLSGGGESSKNPGSAACGASSRADCIDRDSSRSTTARADRCEDVLTKGSDVPVTFEYRDVSAHGLSCDAASDMLLAGGVGAHGFQAGNGWRCSDQELAYECAKGGQRIRFELVSLEGNLSTAEAVEPAENADGTQSTDPLKTPRVPSPGTADGWPAGTSAWAVVLASKATREEAENIAAQARQEGLAEVGLLYSSNHSSLMEGFWVAYTGVLDRAGADALASDAKAAGFADAYARFVNASSEE